MMKYLVLLLAAVSCALASPTAIYPCPNNGTHRLPHGSSCSHFVQCIAGAAVLQECAPGLYFSVELHECTDPYLAECDVQDHLCPLYNDPENIVHLADDSECDVYHICNEGEPVAHRCATGLHWDAVNEQCTYPSLANCQVVDAPCSETGINVIAHPFLCNRYFVCVEGERYPEICPGNLVFDVQRWACHHPEESRCYYWEDELTTPGDEGGMTPYAI